MAICTNINIVSRGYNAANGSNVWNANYDYNFDALPNDDEMSKKYSLHVKYNTQYCVDDIYVTGASVVVNEDANYITLKYSCGTGQPCVDCMGPVGGRWMNEDEEQQADLPDGRVGMYPNPFSINAVLRLSDETEIHNAVLSVYDMSGRLVSSVQNIISTTIVIDKGDMPNGLYFYKLSDDNGNIAHGKFVIAE